MKGRNLLSEMAGGNDDTLNAMSIEQLRTEVIRLRQLNQVQNTQLTALRQQPAVDNDHNINNNNLVQTLVESLRAISIDIKLPKFEENENPNQFLDKLDKFFTVKRINEENKINILGTSFEGRVRVWFETQRVSFLDYNDFKNKFLNELYSIPTRVKIKRNWLARKFETNKETLIAYFQRQVKEAQYFLPKIDDFEIHYTIISQMPIRVREALVTVDFSDYNEISQALTQLDLTFNDKIMTHKESNGPVDQNTNNNNKHNHSEPQNKIKSRELQLARDSNDPVISNC